MGNNAATRPEGESSGGAAGDAPRHLGRYRIEGVIGVGGMGIVLAAHDPELDRAVAIKLLRRGDPASQERLVAEAQAMARLRHRNVVAVHDVGVADGRVFVAMELVPGMTLRAWLQAAARPWRTIVRSFVAAARGLAAAHAAGLVHRDFKADNVLVGEDADVRVADFGIAALSAVAGDDAGLDRGPGEIAGTPAYMAPEQHAGVAAGPAADQFAFAVALWEALAGRRPFGGETAVELHAAKHLGDLAEPAGPAPRWVFVLLRRALAADPDRRYPSMTALVNALERGLERRRRIALAGGAAALVTGTAVAALMLRDAPPRGPDCRLAASDVAQAWNPQARARVDAAFAAGRSPSSAVMRERVGAALDRHAAELADARVAACNATHRGTQSDELLDRRIACLDHRITEMGALIDTFGAGLDAAAIDRSLYAVSELAGAEVCTGEGAVTHPLPPPAVRERVAAAERRRAQAEALFLTGHRTEARAAYDALAVEVRELAFPPLTASVALGRARTIATLSDATDAHRAFEEAAAAAAEAGDDRRIAEAWLGDIELYGDADDVPDEALERLSFAEVAVARSRTPELNEELHVVRSDLLLNLGRVDEARIDIEAALASIAARGAPTSVHTSRVRVQYARILSALGDPRTVEVNRQAVDERIALLGPDHVTVGQLLSNLAAALEDSGDLAEAKTMLLRSLTIKERSLPPGDPGIAFTLHNLGVICFGLGERDAARDHARRALAIREAALGPDHRLTALTVNLLAGLHQEDGQYEDALRLYQRGAGIHERVSGPDAPHVGHALRGITLALLALSRPGEALAPARRAVAIFEKAQGEDGTDVALALSTLAEVHEASGRFAASCEVHARAVAILEKQDPSHRGLVGGLADHGRCLLAAGRIAAARAAAERSLAIVTSTGSASYSGNRARLVLAEVLWTDPATRRQAISIALEARSAYAGSPASGAQENARLETWLATHTEEGARESTAP